MATRHGLNAILYMGPNSGSASAVAETHGLNMNVDTDFAEDSSQGDSWKTYLVGLNDFKLEIDKWYDNSTGVLLNASINKTLMKFYLYPDRADSTIYFYGTNYIGGGGLNAPINAAIDQKFTLVANSQPVYVGPS